LLIKLGYLYYFSKIPKLFGKGQFIQSISEEIPRMSILILNIEEIKKDGRYLFIKFNKKHLIYSMKIVGFVRREMEGYKNKYNEVDGNVEWYFKC
jgi:hypothetical protein